MKVKIGPYTSDLIPVRSWERRYEHFRSDKYYHEDVVSPAILAHNGAIPTPAGVGLGYAVDEERVARATVRRLDLVP